MNQMGFSELEFVAKKKRTCRERFLDQIEAATPWALLVEHIEPFYPKGEWRPAAHRDRTHAAHVRRTVVLPIHRRGHRGRGGRQPVDPGVCRDRPEP